MVFARYRGPKTPDGGKLESGWMYIWVGKLFERRKACGIHTDEKEELKGGGNEGALLWRVFLSPVFLKFMVGKEDPAATAAAVTTLATVSRSPMPVKAQQG